MSDRREYFSEVREVVARLDRAYEWSNLGNKDDPFEELVFIVLATRTSETFYRRTFNRVKQLVGDWNSLPEVDVGRLEDAIKEAGLASKKARTLKRIADELFERFGEVSLDFLETMDTRDAEDFLLELYGVGPKTAKCVLMYALDRAVFPVDTHSVRIANRLGWLETTSRRYTKNQMRQIEERVPPSLRKRLHVRFVQHGRSTCVDGTPRCADCPLTDICDYYRSGSESG